MKSFAALPFRDKARKVRTPKNSKEFPGSLEKIISQHIKSLAISNLSLV